MKQLLCSPHYLTVQQVHRAMDIYFTDTYTSLVKGGIKAVLDNMHRYGQYSILLIGERGFPNKVHHIVIGTPSEIKYDPGPYKNVEYKDQQYTFDIWGAFTTWYLIEELPIRQLIEDKDLHYLISRRRLIGEDS